MSEEHTGDGTVENRSSVNRRRLVKALGVAGATGVAGLASSGSATAKDQKEELRQKRKIQEQYSSSSQSQKAIETYATGVLNELAARNILKNPSSSVFDLESEIPSNIRISDEVEGRNVGGFTTDDGTYTAHIMISKINDEYSIMIHIQPENNKSYAIVKSKSTDKEFIVDPSVAQSKLSVHQGDENVTPSSCGPDSSCTADICATRSKRGCLMTKLHFDCSQGYNQCHCYVSKKTCYDRLKCAGPC